MSYARQKLQTIYAIQMQNIALIMDIALLNYRGIREGRDLKKHV